MECSQGGEFTVPRRVPIRRAQEPRAGIGVPPPLKEFRPLRNEGDTLPSSLRCRLYVGVAQDTLNRDQLDDVFEDRQRRTYPSPPHATHVLFPGRTPPRPLHVRHFDKPLPSGGPKPASGRTGTVGEIRRFRTRTAVT